MKSEPQDAAATAGPEGLPPWAATRSDLSEVFSGLADIQMRSIVTTRLAPTIYLLCILGVGAINLYLAVLMFGYSVTVGVLWTLLIMPVLFVSGVVVVRVALEVILSIFRIVVYLETLMDHIVALKGQTETIVGRTEIIDLPRIQFWKPRRRKGEPAEGDGA
jgi:hypothetical protein